MLQVWDVASGQIVVPAIPSATRWDDVVFSADGREVIATDREHPVRRWRMPGGQPLGPEPAGTAAGDNGLISPRGTRVFRAGVEVLARSVVFDSATGRALVPELAHHGALSSVAFSPDDRTIAVADQSQLRLWDTTTGRLVGAPIDRRGIRRMAFDSAGVWLATASEDGRIRLWSVRSGEEVGRLMTHAGPARTLAFFPDGRRLVSGGDDRLARVFDVGYLGARPDPAQLVREVQVATALRLTPQGQIERLPLEEWQRLRAALGSK